MAASLISDINSSWARLAREVGELAKPDPKEFSEDEIIVEEEDLGYNIKISLLAMLRPRSPPSNIM